MDWKDLGQLISPAAPGIGGLLSGIGSVVGGIAGTVIAGPVGSTIGSQIGSRAGSILGTTFGVPPTPDAIAEAIRADPDAGRKLAEVDALHFQALKAQAESAAIQSSEVNQTIREENAKGVSWWHWRHLIGYIPFVLGGELILLLPAAAFKIVSVSEAVSLIEATMLPLGIISGLLGYVAQDTTKRITTAVTGQQPVGGVIGTIVGGLLRR